MTTPNRRQSFKVQTTPVPVPPSLVQSPYLAPNSMFNKEYSFPRAPAGNQDNWLMDTVPQRPQGQQGQQQQQQQQPKGTTQPAQQQPAQTSKSPPAPPKS